MGDTPGAPKVEFALGSEVSLEHFFKSSFARAFVINCRDTKSLDYEMLDNTVAGEAETNGNNFFSLVNFGNGKTTPDNRVPAKDKTNVWKKSEVNTTRTFAYLFRGESRAVLLYVFVHFRRTSSMFL